eukprot:6181247-Pleurochrysis_carterae.AAC.2
MSPHCRNVTATKLLAETAQRPKKDGDARLPHKDAQREHERASAISALRREKRVCVCGLSLRAPARRSPASSRACSTPHQPALAARCGAHAG